YSTQHSLYVTSNPDWWARPVGAVASGPGEAPDAQREAGDPDRSAAPPERTQVHRFDISAAGPPRYVTSGSVPGRLLNHYSLSEHAGNLRVATTSGTQLSGASPGTSESGVYVLDAETLRRVGEVTGLGRGERI